MGKVGNSYDAESPEAQQQAYDAWADDYERDLCAMGYRLPAAGAAAFARFVAPDVTAILDAGCGGGIQTEPLVQIGYGPFTGLDFSQGMLDVAAAKNLYASLHQMELGKPLSFDTASFDVVYSIGAITPGHAPPESFSELIRVCRPGGLLIFSMRNDAEQLPGYPAAVRQHTDAGDWVHVFSTPPFQSLPYGEPDVRHQIHVYRKAGA